MIKTALKTNIALFALLVLSACASQETSEEQVTDGSLQCRHYETLACEEFSGEKYNCSCEQGDNLRDMLDAYKTPDY